MNFVLLILISISIILIAITFVSTKCPPKDIVSPCQCDEVIKIIKIILNSMTYDSI